MYFNFVIILIFDLNTLSTRENLANSSHFFHHNFFFFEITIFAKTGLSWLQTLTKKPETFLLYLTVRLTKPRHFRLSDMKTILQFISNLNLKQLFHSGWPIMIFLTKFILKRNSHNQIWLSVDLDEVSNNSVCFI